MDYTRIVARDPCAPPAWALKQRHLFRVLADAAVAFEERYTRADGSFVWRQEWPGIDGSDDGYEAYHNWPLLYVLGGSEDVHARSRRLWEAVTAQFTAYGQVYKEFDAHYDWMHHGESSIYLYYFGLADPSHPRDRARAVRFAELYTDERQGNWDPERTMIRSPITGSRGPRFENQWEDWETHRPILVNYPAPFEDLEEVDPDGSVDWRDDKVYAEILTRMNARMMRCDVPLNLTATSLVTSAYLYTGAEGFRKWVLDYTEAWAERIQRNGGICPDNVGPNGEIGETMDGAWWGGYYGWRWPHGLMTILQPLLIAATNCVLLTGDTGYLDVPRGLIDRVLAEAKEENGALLVPHRRMDSGWVDYRPLSPELPLQLWYASQSSDDEELLTRVSGYPEAWGHVGSGRGKGDDIHIAPWYRYLTGDLPEYPDRVLDVQFAEAARRMAVMAGDDGDPEGWDVHHWQDINPVHTEALVQLTMGGPQIIYHGGLLHVRLRYFDALERRPGLPADVATLVDRFDADGVHVVVANTSVLHSREVLIQGGAFGEHEIASVVIEGENGIDTAEHQVKEKYVLLRLPPATRMAARLTMRRYHRVPSYARPWD